MIIYENAPGKAIEAEAHTKADPTLDPPPTYSPLQPDPRDSELPTVASPELPPIAAKPSNFIHISRHHDSIKGNYAVDPAMYIPPSLLPPLAPLQSEKERKNLKLESQHGAIDVEISLVGEISGNNDRTRLDVRSTHGRIGVKLNTPATPRDPFSLTAYSTHNSITLYLPRSYEGLLKATTNHSSATLSDQLAEHTTTFSDIDCTKQCFVGDLSKWEEGEGGWKGDEVTLTSKHGKVKVFYVDEVEPPPAKGRGFLSRILGLA